MADVKIELDKAGVRELLQSSEVLEEVTRIAQSQGGDEVKSFIGFDRAHAIAYGVNKERD